MSKIYGKSLLDDMAQHQSLPMPLLKEAAHEILNVIRDGLRQDGVVMVSNFGTFRLKSVAARQGINPQTRQPITIPAHQRVVFTPCKALRELIQPIHEPPIPISTHAAETENTLVTDDKTPDKAPVRPEAAAATASTAAQHDRTVKQEQSHRTITVATDDKADLSARNDAVAPEAGTGNVSETITTTDGRQALNTAARGGEADETFNLDMGRFEEEPGVSPPSSRNRYLGATALLVLAVMAALLLLDPLSTQHEGDDSDVSITTADNSYNTSVVEDVSHPNEDSNAVNEGKPITEPAQTADKEALPTTPLKSSNANESSIPLQPQQPQGVTGKVASRSAGTSSEQDAFFHQQSHQLAYGESLWKLASKHYREPLLWPHIYQANSSIIDNPDYLREGSTITIPTLQGRPGELSREDRRNIAEGYYLTFLFYQKMGRDEAIFALLEAKRYDASVVEAHREKMQLSLGERMLLQQYGDAVLTP